MSPFTPNSSCYALRQQRAIKKDQISGFLPAAFSLTVRMKCTKIHSLQKFYKRKLFFFFRSFSEKGSERTDELETDLGRASGPNPIQAETAGAGFPEPGPVELSKSLRMKTAQTSLGNLFLCTPALRCKSVLFSIGLV